MKDQPPEKEKLKSKPLSFKYFAVVVLMVSTALTFHLLGVGTRGVTLQSFQELAYTIIFVSGFLGVPLFLVVKFVVKVEHSDYSKFDTIIEAVAETVRPERKNLEESLKSPLLYSSPPFSATYHLQDKQHTINTRKTGELFQRGWTCNGIVRLNFAETEEGFSIKGTTTLQALDSRKLMTFVIEKGLFSPVKGKIYWVEAVSDSLQRVVTGEFEDNFATFTGEWCASDGSRGVLMNNFKSAPAEQNSSSSLSARNIAHEVDGDTATLPV